MQKRLRLKPPSGRWSIISSLCNRGARRERTDSVTPVESTAIPRRRDKKNAFAPVIRGFDAVQPILYRPPRTGNVSRLLEKHGDSGNPLTASGPGPFSRG